MRYTTGVTNSVLMNNTLSNSTASAINVAYNSNNASIIITQFYDSYIAITIFFSSNNILANNTLNDAPARAFTL